MAPAPWIGNTGTIRSPSLLSPSAGVATAYEGLRLNRMFREPTQVIQSRDIRSVLASKNSSPESIDSAANVKQSYKESCPNESRAQRVGSPVDEVGAWSLGRCRPPVIRVKTQCYAQPQQRAGSDSSGSRFHVDSLDFGPAYAGPFFLAEGDFTAQSFHDARSIPCGVAA